MRSRRMFVTAIHSAVAAALSSACGSGQSVSSADGGPNGDASFTAPDGSFVSSDGGACVVPKTVEDVNLPLPVEYLAFRREYLTQMYGVDDAGMQNMDAGLEDEWSSYDNPKSGTACSAAGDAAKCTTDLAAIRLVTKPTDPNKTCFLSQGGSRPGCEKSYLVYTRGDAIGTAETQTEINALLGPIDTVGEAYVAAAFAGFGFPSCSSKYPKNLPTAIKTEGGYELVFMRSDCGSEELLRVKVTTDGTVTELERQKLAADPCAIGRKPEGLVAGASAERGTATGRYFARAAELEAASVVAFRRLARELAHHRAPKRLVARARRSAREEIRHARSTSSIARRHGATPIRATVGEATRRALVDVALENAIEGCVRETYGAAVAHYQAARAGDPAIRAAMRTIAADETRHAELSWDLHRWALGRLSVSERSRVRAAMTDAVATLRAELRVAPEAELRDRAGLPEAEGAARLLAELERGLWADAAFATPSA